MSSNDDYPKVYSIGNYSDTSRRFYIEGDQNHVGVNVFPDSNYSLYVGQHSSGGSIKTDGDVEVGGGVTASKAFVGDWAGNSEYAVFSHNSNNNTGYYALIQDSAGETYLNAPSGKKVHIRNHNGTTDIMQLGSTAVTISKDTTINSTLNVSGNITGTLATAAQPNITSVGNLSSLAVSGNTTVGGDLTLTKSNPTIHGSVGDLTLSCEKSCIVQLDWNSNNPGNDNNLIGEFIVRTGAGDDVFTVDENGSAYISDIIISGSNIYANSSSDYLNIETSKSNAYMRFRINSTDVMRITSSGDVGIGTTIPSSKLDVNGNANVSGIVGIGTSSQIDNETATIYSKINNNGLYLSYQHQSNLSSGITVENRGETHNTSWAIADFHSVYGEGTSGYSFMASDTRGNSATRSSFIKYNGDAYFGNVGINTPSPGYTLDVSGNANVSGDTRIGGMLTLADWNPVIYTPAGYITIKSEHDVFIELDWNGNNEPSAFKVKNGNGTQVFYVNEYGNGSIGGTLSQNSDDRIKDDEQDITSATQTLLKLRPMTFKQYMNTKKEGYSFMNSGLIAQEVYYNAPELRNMVVLNVDASNNTIIPYDISDNSHETQDDSIYDSLNWGDKPVALNYNYLIPYLIKSNQEQQVEIENLKEEKENLKNMIENIQSRLSSLENHIQ